MTTAGEGRLAALTEAAVFASAVSDLLGAADEYGIQPGLCNAGILLAQRAAALVNEVKELDDHELARASFVLDAVEEVFRFGAGNDQGEDAPGESGVGYALCSILAERVDEAEQLIRAKC